MKISFKTKILNKFRLIFRIPFLERMLLKKTIGKPADNFFVKLIPGNYTYPKNTWRTALRNGINYKLDLHDYVDWWLYFGIKEDARVELYKLVNNGNTIFDIGTNVGETLMNFAKLAGNSSKIHGFEPDTINNKRCVENLNLNSFENITLNKKGLGNLAGKFHLKVDTESNRGGNRITNEVGSQETDTIEVITLDEYVKEKKIEEIDLIKIDVEGFELNVLKGAEITLSSFKPVLFIELDDNNLKDQGQSAKELIEYLKKFDYKIIQSETKAQIETTTDFTNCHYDIICKNHPG